LPTISQQLHLISSYQYFSIQSIKKVVCVSFLFPWYVVVDSILLQFRGAKKYVLFNDNLEFRQSRMLINLLGEHYIVGLSPFSFRRLLQYVWLRYTGFLPHVRFVAVLMFRKKESSLKTSNKKILLTKDFLPGHGINNNWVYGVHPQINTQYIEQYQDVIRLRAKPRKKCLLIVGNYSEAYRNTGNINQLNLMDRFSMFSAIQKHFPVFYCYTLAHLKTRLNNEKGFTVIRLNRIDQAEYLEAISEVEYVLCGPGILIPPTHTLYEAALVGSIPITNIGSFLTYDHAKKFPQYNFTNEEELISLINRLKDIESEQDRKKTIELYDQFCSVNRLELLMNSNVSKISTVAENEEYYRYLMENHQSIKTHEPVFIERKEKRRVTLNKNQVTYSKRKRINAIQKWR
jgi:hypothetical protein